MFFGLDPTRSKLISNATIFTDLNIPHTVHHHEPGNVVQLRAGRPRPSAVPRAHAGRLHPRVPAVKRSEHRMRPEGLPNCCIHRAVPRGVLQPEPYNVERRLQAALAEEQLPGSMLTKPFDFDS